MLSGRPCASGSKVKAFCSLWRCVLPGSWYRVGIRIMVELQVKNSKLGAVRRHENPEISVHPTF